MRIFPEIYEDKNYINTLEYGFTSINKVITLIYALMFRLPSYAHYLVSIYALSL